MDNRAFSPGTDQQISRAASAIASLCSTVEKMLKAYARNNASIWGWEKE